MDLLSSYDDETSNISDHQVNKTGNTGMFQSEWENFEKSIGSSSTPPYAASPTESKSSEEMAVSTGKEDVHKESTAIQGSTAKNIEVEEDEEDESHLPPGVRKKNRCHNSSSSSSEDEEKEKKGSHSDTDQSDSDDSDVPQEKSKSKDAKMEETKERRPNRSKEESKRSSRKSRSSKSVSRSRSRSRSPHRKRKKSSDYKKRSRSRSRGRHRKERKHSSRRSRSRERKRSKDRDHRSRHRDQRHSRSRSRDRRKHRERRSSHERSRKSRSRSRSRDRKKRSPSPLRGAKVIKYGDKVIKAGASFGRPPPSKPMTFKEKMRQQFIKAMEEGGDVSQALTSKDGTVICTQTAGTQQVPPPKKAPVPLMANLVTSTAGLAAATITASEAAMQSMIQLQKETTEKTGVEIPKYYNPAAINPVKYAEQVQKRKLLWSKTKDKEINSQWHATTLSSDHDSKSKEKFRKLMGIKQEGASQSEDDNKISEEEMKQKEMFDKLDKEYQYARMATHTHRGIGLGFGSTSYQPPGS